MFPPTEPAHVSDQGTMKTCTAEALAKSVVDGYEDLQFYATKLDFSQLLVTEKLTALFPGQEYEVKQYIKSYN